MANTRPFCYRAEDWRDRHIGVARGLMEIVKRCASNDPDRVTIFAIYEDGAEELVPGERYSRENLASREEALAFIRDRAEKVEEGERHTPGLTSILRLKGALRCRYEDRVEEQIEDYIRTSPRVWLSPEELAREEQKIFRSVGED